MKIEFKKEIKRGLRFGDISIGQVFSFNNPSSNVYVKSKTVTFESINAFSLTENRFCYVCDTSEVILHENAKVVIE